MNHSLGHDKLDTDPPHPLGIVEVPMDVTLHGTAKVHPSPSERGAPTTQARPHARHSIPPYNSPIHGIPTEILLIISRLVTPSRTREDVYALLTLTHVCRFWRTSLICYPRVWTTIFATEKDRRSFVEMSLERSQSLPLEVTVKTCRRERDPTECSCEEGESGELLPNEKTPCEWHFVFEPLAYPKNSKRIQVLNMDFPNASLPRVFTLGNFCLLDSPLPQVTTVVWKGEWTNYTPQPFPGPRSFPNLRSLTFGARWTHSLNKVNNITSFAIRTGWSIDAEEFRLFVLNNLSLETLELRVKIRGSTKGPPADLLNVKSLSLDPCPKVLSNVIHVPAFQRLSSLRISLECEIGDLYTLRATGGGISLSVNSWVLDVAEDWQHLIGYARPTIRYVSIYDQQPVDTYPYGSFSTPLTALMADAHTVDIGLSYSEYWGGEFWIELQELGPQLKTIRFEVSEKMEPFGGSSDPDYRGGHILDKIADLVEHRFKGGSAVFHR